MNADRSLPPAYFDAVYAASDDPWRFESSPYERAKYDATIAALGARHHARGLEIGCSIGVLTARLARHCTALLAVDVSGAAIAAARRRCAALPGVRIERRELPREWPDAWRIDRFDLVVCSEVAYYWNDADLQHALGLMFGATAPGGRVLMVHWTHPVHDYPQTGDAVHDAAAAHAARHGARAAAHARTADYRLDAWVMPG